MYLNVAGVGLLVALAAYAVYLQRRDAIQQIPKTLVTPWGEQVGRTRPIQSKTGDASMATERTRRRAVQADGRLNPRKLKETRTSTGSTTGAVETFFLSSVCPPFPKLELLLDADGAYGDYCAVLDGGGDLIYDGGNEDTIVCGV
jgi:hypothetical protein